MNICSFVFYALFDCDGTLPTYCFHLCESYRYSTKVVVKKKIV